MKKHSLLFKVAFADLIMWRRNDDARNKEGPFDRVLADVNSDVTSASVMIHFFSALMSLLIIANAHEEL